MIVDVSKESCIRAAADGDGDTVRRYFTQIAARHESTNSSPTGGDKQDSDYQHDRPAQEEDNLTTDPAKSAFSVFLGGMTRTLFSEAIANGHVAVVQVLLLPLVMECTGKPLVDVMLPELLSAAINEDYVEIVECLLSHGADTNALIENDTAPLSRAAELGSLEMAQALVAHGANVNARHETTGRTALHEAARQGDVDVVAFLLARGADIDCQDYQLRETPLLSAIKKGNRSVVGFLIEHKAQLNLLNAFGSTALHVANVEGQREIQQMLQAAGAQVLEVPRTPRR